MIASTLGIRSVPWVLVYHNNKNILSERPTFSTVINISKKVFQIDSQERKERAEHNKPSTSTQNPKAASEIDIKHPKSRDSVKKYYIFCNITLL